jgi:membrane associated rhomboid family serine protease
MTPTPVGMRCPACARERTKVRRLTAPRQSRFSVTNILIAINVVVFLAETWTGAPLGGGGGGSVWYHGILYGPALTGYDPASAYVSALGTHQYWRLLTGGFIHDGILDIAINMLSLWFVGRALEPAIGSLDFGVVYFASLLAGSFGVMLFQPDVPTVGASGAIFGIFGALIVLAYRRGVSLMQTGLLPILALNVIITLTLPNISLGAHLGGFAGGLICGWLVVEVHQRRGRQALALAGCGVLAAASVAGAIALAGSTGLTPHGLTL